MFDLLQLNFFPFTPLQMEQNELSKEIKRFERMQIDLKSTLDRLQWRLDCESKVYYNLLDQFQKMQIDLYYLQNLTNKYEPVHHHHHYHPPTGSTTGGNIWCP